MADMAIRLAKHPRPQNRDLCWNTFLMANRDRCENESATETATMTPEHPQ